MPTVTAWREERVPFDDIEPLAPVLSLSFTAEGFFALEPAESKENSLGLAARRH